MRTMSIEEAQDALEHIFDIFADGRETEIVLTREGNPVAKLVPPDGNLVTETEDVQHT